jgi:hypothetical protein
MSQLSLRTPSGGTINITAEDTAVSKTLTLPAGDGDVYNQSNIVGTVSESAGVPTGAIIESGSNANGEYVKYADGTLMCWQEWAVESMADYTTREETWTFPVAYTAAPNVSVTGVRDATEATKKTSAWPLENATTTAVGLACVNDSGTSSDGVGMSAQAHGFWY